MNQRYTTRHAARLYNLKSEQTIRNWIKEYAEYFSASVSPGKGIDLLLSDEDMAVLDMIASMRTDRRPADEIHAALRSGQRGSLPHLTAEQLEALARGDIENHLSVQLNNLRVELDETKRRYEEALAETRSKLEEAETRLRPTQDELLRAKTQLERMDKVEALLEAAAEREKALLREIGQLEGAIQLLKDQKDGK